VTNVDRREAMAVSLERTARALHLPEPAIDLVGRAYTLAMRPRVDALDEHDAAYLHPGRTVLVLLQDVGPLPGDVLAAAAAHESADAALRVPLEEARRELGQGVADLVASCPLPGDEALAERLVTLEENARLVALAERLDHLRHAHLRHDPEWWRALRAEVEFAWAPVAERTHPRLADRYRAWLRAMGRRLGSQPD
jgi:(p)ppGpp synthase/HD superfamily hydrolase